MKIQFNGSGAVDVPGHDDVQPGAVIDVDDDTGRSLLAAGTSYPDDGPPVPPESPQWTVPAGKANKSAEAGKEGAA